MHRTEITEKISLILYLNKKNTTEETMGKNGQGGTIFYII